MMERLRDNLMLGVVYIACLVSVVALCYGLYAAFTGQAPPSSCPYDGMSQSYDC